MKPKHRYTDKQALQLAVNSGMRALIDNVKGESDADLLELVDDFFEQDVLGLPEKQAQRLTDADGRIRTLLTKVINTARRDLMKQENAIHQAARARAKTAPKPRRRLCKSCESAITSTDIAAGKCTQCGARIRKTSDVRRG